MKIRAMPMMLSLALTLGILFGGWNTYQHFYVQQPIRAFIAEKQQVELSNIHFYHDQVKAELNFTDPNTFAADYKDIKDFISDQTGKKVVLQLPVVDEQMKDLWEEEYFSIAEAMKKQEYSEIPKIMEKIKMERHIEKTVSRMDEENVYVFLQKGSNHLYAVLPFKEEVKPIE
ncbi:hypothetical protein BEP19_02100 [Ammoniphilus oxalaticus]|uniref:Uncharacterized protein n=1 Tax=Ammoniphilus oxalaticus TaxID=66863 RepID=A0A419SNA5_9BACL|nr:hypothetical protein [Ammoniphilus oxalaticus]RKD25757.1 hypothetical protein BEP19_02100 [Ammoniphilus oxalaticus]